MASTKTASRTVMGTNWPIRLIYGKARSFRGWYVAQICNTAPHRAGPGNECHRAYLRGRWG